jgi:Tol biopolymer transport system component
VLFTAAGALYTYAFDHALLRRVTPAGLPDPAEAAWSPDGRALVVAVRSGGRRSGLWITGADGSRPRRIVAGRALRAPQWLPAGGRKFTSMSS